MENLTTELIALLIAVAIYLVRQWLGKKNADLDKKAEQIQSIILNGLTKARAAGNKEGRGTDALKKIAVDAINKEIAASPKVATIMKDLNISFKQEDIDEYIETGLHAAKLGLSNVLKDRFKRLK